MSYSMTGAGGELSGFREIVWCAACGALGFRDYGGAAGGATVEKWNRPRG